MFSYLPTLDTTWVLPNNILYLRMQAAYKYIPRIINPILSQYHHTTKKEKILRLNSSVIHTTASSYHSPYGVKITHCWKFHESVTRWHTGVKCCMLGGSSFHTSVELAIWKGCTESRHADRGENCRIKQMLLIQSCSPTITTSTKWVAVVESKLCSETNCYTC